MSSYYLVKGCHAFDIVCQVVDSLLYALDVTVTRPTYPLKKSEPIEIHTNLVNTPATTSPASLPAAPSPTPIPIIVVDDYELSNPLRNEDSLPPIPQLVLTDVDAKEHLIDTDDADDDLHLHPFTVYERYESQDNDGCGYHCDCCQYSDDDEDEDEGTFSSAASSFVSLAELLSQQMTDCDDHMDPSTSEARYEHSPAVSLIRRDQGTQGSRFPAITSIADIIAEKSSRLEAAFALQQSIEYDSDEETITDSSEGEEFMGSEEESTPIATSSSFSLRLVRS